MKYPVLLLFQQPANFIKSISNEDRGVQASLNRFLMKLRTSRLQLTACTWRKLWFDRSHRSVRKGFPFAKRFTCWPSKAPTACDQLHAQERARRKGARPFQPRLVSLAGKNHWPFWRTLRLLRYFPPPRLFRLSTQRGAAELFLTHWLPHAGRSGQMGRQRPVPI